LTGGGKRPARPKVGNEKKPEVKPPPESKSDARLDRIDKIEEKAEEKVEEKAEQKADTKKKKKKDPKGPEAAKAEENKKVDEEKKKPIKKVQMHSETSDSDVSPQQGEVLVKPDYKDMGDIPDPAVTPKKANIPKRFSSEEIAAMSIKDLQKKIKEYANRKGSIKQELSKIKNPTSDQKTYRNQLTALIDAQLTAMRDTVLQKKHME
jgi:hypothetical protein